MAVCEDERADIGERPTHHVQLAGDVPVVAGHPCVDDRHRAGLLDEVGVDDAVVADAMNVRCDLYDEPLQPSTTIFSLPKRSRRPGICRGRTAEGSVGLADCPRTALCSSHTSP